MAISQVIKVKQLFYFLSGPELFGYLTDRIELTYIWVQFSACVHLDMREFCCARVSFVRHVVHLHCGGGHLLRTWEVAWENDESKQQQKERTQNGNSCPRIQIVFLDQYSWSKNGQIINKVDKKESFKSHSPWIF